MGAGCKYRTENIGNKQLRQAKISPNAENIKNVFSKRKSKSRHQAELNGVVDRFYHHITTVQKTDKALFYKFFRDTDSNKKEKKNNVLIFDFRLDKVVDIKLREKFERILHGEYRYDGKNAAKENKCLQSPLFCLSENGDKPNKRWNKSQNTRKNVIHKFGIRHRDNQIFLGDWCLRSQKGKFCLIQRRI